MKRGPALSLLAVGSAVVVGGCGVGDYPFAFVRYALLFEDVGFAQVRLVPDPSSCSSVFGPDDHEYVEFSFRSDSAQGDVIRFEPESETPFGHHCGTADGDCRPRTDIAEGRLELARFENPGFEVNGMEFEYQFEFDDGSEAVGSLRAAACGEGQ